MMNAFYIRIETTSQNVQYIWYCTNGYLCETLKVDTLVLLLNYL